MKTIVVHPFSPADAGMFDEHASENSAAPWLYLKYAFSQRGINLQTSYRYQGRLADALWVVFMNAPQSLGAKPSIKMRLRQIIKREPQIDFFECCRSEVPAKRLALMLWEPEVVYPLNVSSAVHQRFARVFTWAEALLTGAECYRPIVWPQPPIRELPENVAFDQRKLLCNFSGNKASDHGRELYSARVEVIRYMERHHPNDFDHFGPGWSSDFPSWRGKVENKFLVYPDYKFGLCYENMEGVAGYITEKIFDCLRAGCVPVYWGAPDISERVDPCAYIDRRQFAGTGEMIDFLRRMPEERWLEMRQAGFHYLRSVKFARYLPRSFASMFHEGLFDEAL